MNKFLAFRCWLRGYIAFSFQSNAVPMVRFKFYEGYTLHISQGIWPPNINFTCDVCVYVFRYGEMVWRFMTENISCWMVNHFMDDGSNWALFDDGIDYTWSEMKVWLTETWLIFIVIRHLEIIFTSKIIRISKRKTNFKVIVININNHRFGLINSLKQCPTTSTINHSYV